jgi:hypothetical protein
MDHSEHHRRRVLDIIHLFAQKDIRDELGVAAVRDGFSELLFPGTSTIQTRAAYFLFVPWLYRILEQQRIPSSRAGAKLHSLESALLEAIRKSDDTDGLLGKEAGPDLKRPPSNVYWVGLGRLGIRVFPGSQDQYHRSLDAFYLSDPRRQKALRNDDGEPLAEAARTNWHLGLPDPPAGFPSGAEFRLQASHAQYLKERVLSRAPGTLLAFLVAADEAPPDGSTPWESLADWRLPPLIQNQLDHARNFAEVMRGAALLYNLMLAQKKGDTDAMDDFTGRIRKEWAPRMRALSRDLATWNRQDFWQTVDPTGTSVQSSTGSFVNDWFAAIQVEAGVPQPEQIPEQEAACALIVAREWELKGRQGRLCNRQMLELWGGDAGTGLIGYRWNRVRKITEDILKGLIPHA